MPSTVSQFPHPSLTSTIAAMYCAHDAVAENDMSISPHTSTTKSPAAVIAMNELLSIKVMMFSHEKKSLEYSEMAVNKHSMTTNR